MTDLDAQSAESADVRGLPECCAGEGYPGIAHDLLAARTERDEANAAADSFEAEAAIAKRERDRAVEWLRAIRDLPSQHDLMFNPVAVAMNEMAKRALKEVGS